MEQYIAIIVSTLALTVSAITAYLTLFRRGTVCMTQPTVIFFGPDGRSSESDHSANKVYLRTLLYATSKRGRIIESMFVKLRWGETSQNFNIWVYGDDSLARGSGIFVGENGVACNHHFLLPKDGVGFEFRSGEYEVEVFALLAGETKHRNLLAIRLTLPDHIGAKLSDPRAGVYFDWGPDSQQYQPHVDTRPEPKLPEALLESLIAMGSPPLKTEPEKTGRNEKKKRKGASEGLPAEPAAAPDHGGN